MPAIRMNVVDKGLRCLITRIRFSFFNDGLVPSNLKFTLRFSVICENELCSLNTSSWRPG